MPFAPIGNDYTFFELLLQAPSLLLGLQFDDFLYFIFFVREMK